MHNEYFSYYVKTCAFSYIFACLFSAQEIRALIKIQLFFLWKSWCSTIITRKIYCTRTNSAHYLHYSKAETELLQHAYILTQSAHKQRKNDKNS
jgi:hypothetical protein